MSEPTPSTSAGRTVDYLVLADAVALAEGKHYIHGAGWDRIYGTDFPLTHPQIAAAVRIAVPRDQLPRVVEVEFDLLDDDGLSIVPDHPGPFEAPLDVAPDTPGTSAFHLPLAFTLPDVEFAEPGRYSAVVRIDGQESRRATFEVWRVEHGAPDDG